MASGSFQPWAGPYEEQIAAVEKRLQRFVLVDGQLMQRVLEPLFLVKSSVMSSMEVEIFRRDEGQRLPRDRYRVDNDYHILSLRELVGPNSRYDQIINALRHKGINVPEVNRFDVDFINPNRFSKSAEGANILVTAKAILDNAQNEFLRDTRDLLSEFPVREYAVLHAMYHAVREVEAQEDETLVSEALEQSLYSFLDMCDGGHKIFRGGIVEKAKTALAAWEERSVELESVQATRRSELK
jgi:hypothetical protein